MTDEYDDEAARLSRNNVISFMSGVRADGSPRAVPVNRLYAAGIGPRAWIYSHLLIRKFVSFVGAPGGTGKSAYVFAIAVSVAAGLELLAQTVHEPGNVWIYNLEDPEDELYRRLRAVLRHHNVSWSEVEERLFITSGRQYPLKIAHLDEENGGRTAIANPDHVDALIEQCKTNNIRVLIVDPFVKSHGLVENNNEQIDLAMSLWARVADEADCAVLLVHHFRKSGEGSAAGSFRGASSGIDASRAAEALRTMSDAEAGPYEIPDDQRWRYIRIDNAKLNIAPPPGVVRWVKLVSVDIDNARGGRPSDWVQTVERWNPPSAPAIFPEDILPILEVLHAGCNPGTNRILWRFKPNSPRWAGNVLRDFGRNPAQAKAVLADLVEKRLLLVVRAPDGAGHQSDAYEVVEARISELRRNSANPSIPDD